MINIINMDKYFESFGIIMNYLYRHLLRNHLEAYLGLAFFPL